MKRAIVMSAVLWAGLAVLATDDPPAEPKKEAVDVAKTAERIVQNANEAGKRLGAKDPGKDTRKIQQEILRDIDALIRKAQEPPPEQNMGGGMSNMGGGTSNMGGGTSKEPMAGKGSSANGPPSRKERRERAKQNAGNSGVGVGPSSAKTDPLRPESKSGMNPFDGPANRIASKASVPRLPDIYKEVWGHLPEKMRQEMDLYFRERFMPRYSELLRQYYSSLAERGSKNGP